MKKQPIKLVSVIIPTYNRAHFLKTAIESVLNQSYPYLEIIIVNDGSTDKTETVLQGFKDPLLKKLTLKNNSGISHARNMGIKLARGDYFNFFDDDDVMFPDAIVKRVNFLESHPEHSAVVGRIAYPIDADGNRIRSNNIAKDIRDVYKKYRAQRILTYETIIKDGGVFGHTTILYRQSFIKKIGFFDESLKVVDDIDFTFRAAAISPLPFLDVPVMKYRLHSGNSSMIIDKNNNVHDIPQIDAAGKSVVNKHRLIQSQKGQQS